MTFTEDGCTPLGHTPEQVARKLCELAVDVIGANCSVGPAKLLPVVQALARHAAQVDCRGLSEQGVQLVLREGKTDALLAALASQAFDLVITDAPLPAHLKVRAFNHLLGESDVTLFAEHALARRYRPGFPKSLDGAPLLLPSDNTALRRALDQWLQEQGIRPRLVAEIEDSALLKVFGQHGAGIFAAPSVVAAEVKRQYGVRSARRGLRRARALLRDHGGAPHHAPGHRGDRGGCAQAALPLRRPRYRVHPCSGRGARLSSFPADQGPWPPGTGSFGTAGSATRSRPKGARAAGDAIDSGVQGAHSSVG